MSTQTINKKIRSYILLSKTCSGGCDKTISTIIELEEIILNHFDLPSAYQFTSKMERIAKRNENVDVLIDLMYHTLEAFCIDRLFASIKSKSQVLKEGKYKSLDAQEVLPFIGYNTTEFNRFLFHDIYCKKHCSEKQLLRYLQLEQTSKTVGRYRQPYYGKYLQYLHHIQNKKSIKVITESPYFEKEYHEDAVFAVNNLYVIAIDVQNSMVSTMEIAIPYRGYWLELKLWSTLPQVQYLLLHAMYITEVSSLLLALKYHDYNDSAYYFNIRRLSTHFIEIRNISIELERLDRKSDDVKLPYDFLIANIYRQK